MSKRGKVPSNERPTFGQLKDVVIMFLEAIPGQLTFDAVAEWLKRKKQFSVELKELIGRYAVVSTDTIMRRFDAFGDVMAEVLFDRYGARPEDHTPECPPVEELLAMRAAFRNGERPERTGEIGSQKWSQAVFAVDFESRPPTTSELLHYLMDGELFAFAMCKHVEHYPETASRLTALANFIMCAAEVDYSPLAVAFDDIDLSLLAAQQGQGYAKSVAHLENILNVSVQIASRVVDAFLEIKWHGEGDPLGRMRLGIVDGDKIYPLDIDSEWEQKTDCWTLSVCLKSLPFAPLLQNIPEDIVDVVVVLTDAS